ncbi:DUF4383 domain-containing protein [Auraticoccus sp. F435]|uniref:DUF4383 domain-containing protein n=1 Tax=Auraticoccus cholistanensis TaxID=2656650 RepID=A0A6A9URK5_9ACTN|nr:DUF4383 domain-containing protein [Auraticoccus cholistanensis]MVA75516.1 DUF4383 domain-containing protein [Auraticoccus cholistanensis]
MTVPTSSRADRAGRTAVQKAALAVGVVFLLVGVLGFVPGITSNYDTMSFASHHSEAMLLGIFQVSILHNIVHLLFGIAGLLMARSVSGARSYLVVGGIIYLVLFLYGLFVPQDSSANFVPLNLADDILHLLLGIGMVGLGLALTRDRGRVNA